MAESKLTVDDILDADASPSGTIIGPVTNLTSSGDGADNRLVGTSADDTLSGLGGNDQLFGFAGNDTLDGGADDDRMFGGGGTDSLTGGTGDDQLTGGGGDDTLDGGAGTDTAVYTGNFDDYVIDTVAGTITDTRGIEGTDTLTDIEVFQFADGKVIIVPPSGSINDAINNANDGDTILLSDGVYREQVSIVGRSDLSIVGSSGTVIEAPDSLLAFNVASPTLGARDVGAVVEVAFSSNITISGIDVDGRGLGPAAVSPTGAPTDFPTNFAGVLMLNSSGAIDDVDIEAVRDPLVGGELSGTQTGDAIAIYNGDGEARTVTVTDNTLTDFQKTGGRFVGDGLTVIVTENTVEGAGLQDGAGDIVQNGFTIEQGATGQFIRNTISEIGNLRGDFPSAGILAVDPGDQNPGLGLQFFQNTISGVSDGSGGFEETGHTGILIRGSANNVRITDNTFQGVLTGVAGIQDVDGKVFSSPDGPNANEFIDMVESFTPITGGGTRPGLNVAVSGIENDLGVDISTTNGPDLLQGSNFNDRIFAAGGDDFISGEDGDDRLDGREGDDTLLGGNGNDTLVGRAGEDLLEGGEGDDTLLGGGQIDLLRGEGGDDFLNGGSGDDIVNGGIGEDELLGNIGNDELNGGSDDDRLDGGAGDDILRGHSGTDTFVFNAGDAGSDTVIGFALGETVELNGFGFASVGAASAAFSQDGTDVVFSAGSVTARFEGTNLAAVTANIALGSGSSSETVTRVAEPVAAEDTFATLDDFDWSEIG